MRGLTLSWNVLLIIGEYHNDISTPVFEVVWYEDFSDAAKGGECIDLCGDSAFLIL